MSASSNRVSLSKGLVRTQLDDIINMGCGKPGCTEDHGDLLFFRSRCHADTRGVDASYIKGSGVLELSCQVCDQIVMRIRVAE